MVRRIVGITVEAGRGYLSNQDIKNLLVSYSELPARYTAPPSGLFLEKILYKSDKLPRIKVPVQLL